MVYYNVIAIPQNGRDEFYAHKTKAAAFKDARKKSREYWRIEIERVTTDDETLDIDTDLIGAYENGVKTC